MGSLPPRIQELAKVNDGQPLRSITTTSKVKDNRGFHGSEYRVAGIGGSIVQKVALVDSTILGLRCSFTDDPGKCSESQDLPTVWNRTSQPCPFLMWNEQ